MHKFTLEEDLKVQYCIPEWLKCEQIKINTAKVKGRIETDYAVRDEPIALVNFGPSLNDTWEKVKDFKYVMSCSGSHKFLVERGIIPTYHIDVDPREHKCLLIGTPQKETEYLIASTCHPKLFDLLADYNLKLWHIFDTTEDGLRLLPRGEWALTGGCSVGVRTLTLARFLGFRDLHVFGMDGCIKDNLSHAAEHPKAPKKWGVFEYNGTNYFTSPPMLAAVKTLWHELDQLKDIKIEFYGEGLVQAMFKDWKRKENQPETFIAFNRPELISSSYCQLNAQLHADNLAYGVGGSRHAELVQKMVKKMANESGFVSVLDYGCGKGYLAKSLPFPIYEYDPAIPGKTESPRPADLVVCTDVLEHIEPDKLHFVLDDLARCVKQSGFFVINTTTSTKVLADGRNSHLIVKDKGWWMEKLLEHFVVAGLNTKGPCIFVIVAPKEGHKTAATVFRTAEHGT